MNYGHVISFRVLSWEKRLRAAETDSPIKLWLGCYRRDYLRTTVGAPARIFGDDFSLGD